MNDCQMLFFPQRPERSHRRVEAKKAIEVENGLARNVDARPHGIVRALGVWDDDVEAGGGASLENHDEAFVLEAAGRCFRSHDGAAQKRRQRRSSHQGQSPVSQEYASSNGHGFVSWLSLLKLGGT